MDDCAGEAGVDADVTGVEAIGSAAGGVDAEWTGRFAAIDGAGAATALGTWGIAVGIVRGTGGVGDAGVSGASVGRGAASVGV
ncbi:hypothetical protein, partial [Microbacterium sp. UFMG61]|uniref:hypothetical protein n=1 Tax=Microbacterium sp. UFMG61 TaxID=2745935 RepID=UPI001E4E46CC